MYVTRQADYAVRCVLFLAQRPGTVTPMRKIASSMRIPPEFLSKILQKLVRAHLVRSVRGVQGGFELAQKPSEISVLDVVTAIQGPCAARECAVEGRVCSLQSCCAVHPIWTEIRDWVDNRLRRATFDELAADALIRSESLVKPAHRKAER
jgi:Rrf2 family protein